MSGHRSYNYDIESGCGRIGSPIQVSDIVLAGDPNRKRLLWSLGRVEAISRTGRIRRSRSRKDRYRSYYPAY